jgi:hypothetical protein
MDGKLSSVLATVDTNT